MSEWETISAPSDDDGWEPVPEQSIQQPAETMDPSLFGVTPLDQTREALSKTPFIGGALKTGISFGQSIYSGARGFLSPSETPISTRMGQSIKVTPRGKKEYLEAIYGQGNVRINTQFSDEYGQAADPSAGIPSVPISTGETIQVRDKNGIWKELDESQFTYADMADVIGPAAEVGVNVGALWVPGGQTPQGQTVATAAGRGLRQGASALLPGRDYENPAIDIPVDIAEESAKAFAANKLLQAGAKGVDYAKNVPTRTYLERTGQGVPGKPVDPAKIDPVAQKRVASFERKGIQPSFAQATHSKLYESAEQMGASGIKGSQRAFDFYTKEANNAVKALDDEIASYGPRPDADLFGVQISNAYEKASTTIKRARSQQWNVAYEEATKLTQGKPFIPLPSYIEGLKAELREASKLSSSSRQTIINQVQKDLRLVARPVKQSDGTIHWTPRNLRAADLKQLHNRLSEGSFVEGVESATASQAVSSKLKRALDEDVANFDAAISGQQNTRSAAGLIQEAWGNWGNASAKLARVSKDAVGKALKTADRGGLPEETIVDRALKMKPSELRGLMARLRKFEPETYKRFPQLVLYNARQKATLSPPGTVSESANFSMEKFLANLPKDEATYNMIFRNAGRRQSVQDLQSIFKTYAESVGHGAPRGLATELRTGAGNIGGTIAKGGAPWIFLLRQVSDVMGGGSISKKMFSKEGIDGLMKLSKTDPESIAKGYIFADLIDNYWKEDGMDTIGIPRVSDYESEQ